MTDTRPDPDALLAQVQRDEAAARRGRLKIFFGANAGVGKTFAMLAAAHAAQQQGRVVRIGVVETHGRADTEAIARDVQRLPLRDVAHKGQVLREFDLDAALGWGAAEPGGVLLLDELAHSNAPGSRHSKRWQDAQELCEAGVEVWTTLNVQHLESLNDVVGGITGIRVWETLPDKVFDEADEVVVVDLPPDELLQRLKEGKVYLPAQAERAAANFFRKGNLLALRELALRRTADRVDDQMQAWRREHTDVRRGAVWPNRESLLACVGPGAASDKVVRSAARLAQQLELDWHAVHVETARGSSDADRQRVQRTLELAQSLGARTAVLSAPEIGAALVGYAREHNLARLVVGRRERAWRWPGRPTLAEALSHLAEEMDVLQVALPTHARSPQPPPQRELGLLAPHALRGYAAGLAGTLGVTVAGHALLLGFMEPTNIAMLYLLTVVGVALRFGRAPAALAALLGVAAFDFVFVEPRWSFAVGDAQYLITFAVLLLVGLVIGQLAAGLQAQARAAQERERRVRGLYAMSRDLGAALVPEQVAEIATRFLRAEFGTASAVLTPAAGATPGREVLAVLPGANTQPDLGVAQWAFDHGQPAGQGTDTLPASACLMLPLTAPMRLRGVLAVEGRGGRWSPEQRELLDTCAALLAISLERIHYIDVAQASTLQIESERLRNSLLTAISHDLRTPLAALVGLADALRLTPLNGSQADVADAMRRSALRMSALVGNLLDMARLQSGTVQLNRQWLPLQEVVGSALAGLDEVLAGREVVVTLSPELPLVALDAVLIERVLVNLLENAAKYASGAIRISASTAGRHIEIDVADNGPGFPAGREAQLFDKFERGDRESATPGVGLGLAIAKAIVEAHGGRISAHNPAAGGACVRIELPLGQPPQERPE
ncbi:DUF4118 domain-containing protein [Roseateles sp. DC23W]|uniref:histidine kinase n=1 Tax=Pelomonas dachongensis TaxID=3299029 RepID=A0ABW7ESU3_9BURK